MNKPIRFVKRKFILTRFRHEAFFLLIFIISGCGFWNNFKTYFNTYYNANLIFNETEIKILDKRKELFEFNEEKISSNLSKELDKVIKKTSAILQHNKESNYIEEALILTGKSFYYQQNYSRALRKFNELASIKDSELQIENKYWIAKSYLQLHDFDKALLLLDEVKNEAIYDEEEEILSNVYKSKIAYLIYQEEFELATSEINEFFETNLTDELRAEVLFEMGLLYELIEDYESAEQSFAKVEDYSPTFEVEFNSKFGVARLKKELGDVDKSLELLQDLQNEDKFSDNWDLIGLEIGKIFYDRNEIDDAYDMFTEVDTSYDRTEASGIAGFYRAEILENYYHLYDSAMVIYKKTTSLPVPDEIRNRARKKSGLLNKYISYHKKLKDLGTQLLYITEDNAFFLDSLDYVQKYQRDSLKAAETAGVDARGNKKKTRFNPKYKKPVRPKISADSLHSLNSKFYFELANLLFSEFDDPDSAFFYYDLSLKEKEENPNQAQTYYAMGSYYLIKENKVKADSLFTLVFEKYQFDPIRNEAARHIGKPQYDFDKDPVEDKFNSAEAYYDSNKYHVAIGKLFEIYEESPKSIFASKSLYTIGYILENDLDMLDSAASVYNILHTKYRTTEYAKAIQNKFSGFNLEQKRLEAIQDSINNAQQAILDSLEAKNKALSKQLTINDSTIVIDTSVVSDTTNFDKAILDTTNLINPINNATIKDSISVDLKKKNKPKK